MIHHWVELGDVGPGDVELGGVVPGGTDGPGGDKMKTARVFWINGPGSAGTGKSTIAYTIARDLDVHRKLGASFFCSRGNADCSDPALIFPTIAYQLGLFYPPLQEKVAAVLKADPEAAYLTVDCQLERLIVKPILALKGQMPFCVVVIDALDECQNGGAASSVLSSLAQYITALSPVKFLITSRPDVSIVNEFTLGRLSQTVQRCILHHIEQKVVETDLQLYLYSHLQRAKKIYRVDGSWPSVRQIQALVNLSSGLFIFAATAANFIQDRKYSDPQGQLSRLLNAVSATGATPHEFLDQLYLQVLENAFPNISPQLASRVKLVLGSLALLCNPLSPSNLEQLLGLPIPLQNILEQLQSVVGLPNDNNEFMHLLHPSFHDFLISQKRCTNPKFLVKPELQHSYLAQACLKAMKLLRQDICNIKQPWKLHHELNNLPESVHLHVPQFLQYACRHWSQHLLQGSLSDELLHLLEEFCNKYLLCWVEACSLIGDLRGALASLKIVLEVISVCFIHIIFC